MIASVNVRNMLIIHILQSLQNYLLPKGYSDLFDEEKRLKYLSKDSRKVLIDLLFDYLMQNSTSPQEKDIILACKATVQLFKTLNTIPSDIGGIVSIILLFRFFYIFQFVKFNNKLKINFMQDILYDQRFGRGFVFDKFANKKRRDATKKKQIQNT